MHAACVELRRRRAGRRRLRADPACAGPRPFPARLHQHPCFAAAALARRRADPAGHPRRRRETGITIMRMEQASIPGRLLRQKRADRCLTNRRRRCTTGSRTGCALHRRSAAADRADELAACRRSRSHGITYAAKIAKTGSGDRLATRAARLDRQIRAFNPVPGAFTTLGGETREDLARPPVAAGDSRSPARSCAAALADAIASRAAKAR